MGNLNILPVILGNGINAYSMARTFHEAYGVSSLVLTKRTGVHVENSKIIKVLEIPGIDRSETLLKTANELYRQYGKDKTLIIIGTGDHYARLISKHKEELSEMFVTPVADLDVMDILISKEDFYTKCKGYGLDFPATFIYKYGMGMDFNLGFEFPVVVKPTESISYNELTFEGQKKVYFLDTEKELKETIRIIYEAGYRESLIIQEEIPGSDDATYDLQIYSGKDRQVKFMSYGNCILGEHYPLRIGCNNATITDYNEPLMKKVELLLNDIGYQGLADADIKYDYRDGKYKVFEINARQGRSHYRVTGAGDNIAQMIVDDYILDKPMEIRYAERDHFWTVVPLPAVYKYVDDQEKLEKARKLIRAGKFSSSLYYKEDMGLKRRLYLRMRDIEQMRKYRKYMGKKSR